MNKKRYCGIAVVLLGTLLSAQNQSPIKEATNGLFSAESDNVVSSTGFQNIVFDTALVSTSYGILTEAATSETGTPIVDGGLLNVSGIVKAGPVKIGAAYSSPLFKGLILPDKTTPEGTTAKTKVLPFNHNLQLLVGLPNDFAAVTAGIQTSGSIKDVDSPDAQTISQENTVVITPSLGFGMSLLLPSGHKLTPSASLSFAVSNRTGAFGHGSARAGSNISGTDDKGVAYEKVHMYRSYKPAVSVGMGVNFPSANEKNAWSAGFNYAFSALIMPEKYIRESVGGTITNGQVYRTDSGQSHAFSVNGTFTRLITQKMTVKAKALLGFDYSASVDGGPKRLVGVTNPTLSTLTQETQILGFVPTISVGATYQVNEAFSWFAGADFIPMQYTYTKNRQYDEKEYANYSAANEKTTESHNIGSNPYFSRIGLGLAFAPAQELSMSLAVVTLPAVASQPSTLFADILDKAMVRFGLTWKK